MPKSRSARRSCNLLALLRVVLPRIIVLTFGLNAAHAATLSISATPASVSSGDATTLTWSSTGATNCAASGGWSGAKASSGSQLVVPNKATNTFILNCSGPLGSASATAIVSLDTCPSTASAPATPSAPMVNPSAWPLEILSWQLDRAYPGVCYSTRIGVKGGAYPYTFATRQAPSGMRLNARTGEVIWLAPNAAAPAQRVEIEVTDSLGAKLTTSWDIAVTTQGFYFVSTSGSDSTGANGSRASPWRTLAYANNALRNHSPSDIIYVMAGTYPVNLEIGARNQYKSPLVWMTWPGDRVVLDAGKTVAIGINTRPTDRVLFQGFEWQNATEKMFWLQGTTSNIVWRGNTMHGIESVGRNNPAFIFSEDDSTFRPIEGRVQYDRLVVQDNVFYTLRNYADIASQPSPEHGAAAVLYNVQNFLFEDNEVFDIDGRCVGDKDDGYYNTFRHNVLHNCSAGGIRLENQITQGQIEVNHNLMYGMNEAIVIGWQPGYIRDVRVHHNTIVDGLIRFRGVLNDPRSVNFLVSNNLIVRTDAGRNYNADEPEGLAALNAGKITIDNNLLWTTGAYVFSGDSAARADLATWKASGHDLSSLFVNPGLINYRLPPGSTYLGRYGRDY